MTPTSATGRREVRTSRRAGFTLVELLMTVAIIGLAAGAVVLSVPDPRPSVGAEAEALAARLVQAREEAVLTNRSVAVELTSRGYQTSVFDGAEWSTLAEGPFKAADWSEDTRLAMGAESVRVLFDPTGSADPLSLTLSRGETARTVAVDAAGEVTVRG